MSTEDDLPLRITHGPHIHPRTVTIEQYELVVNMLIDLVMCKDEVLRNLAIQKARDFLVAQ